MEVSPISGFLIVVAIAISAGAAIYALLGFLDKFWRKRKSDKSAEERVEEISLLRSTPAPLPVDMVGDAKVKGRYTDEFAYMNSRLFKLEQDVRDFKELVLADPETSLRIPMLIRDVESLRGETRWMMQVTIAISLGLFALAMSLLLMK